jgi:hypothetical protein
MRGEQRVNIAGHPFRVVGEGHRRTANDEQIRDHAAPHEPFAESGKRPLEIGTTHQCALRVRHAAARS